MDLEETIISKGLGISHYRKSFLPTSQELQTKVLNEDSKSQRNISKTLKDLLHTTDELL